MIWSKIVVKYDFISDINYNKLDIVLKYRSILILFLVCFFSFVVITAHSQEDLSFYFSNTPEVLRKEKFDLNLFKKKKKKNNFYSYNTVDARGDSVKITLSENLYYVEKIEYLHHPFAVEKNYDKRTLKLVKYTPFMHRSPFGKEFQLNPFGMLEKEINHDNNFPFSWNDLHTLMLNKFNLNIYDQSYYDKDPLIVKRTLNPAIYYIKLPRRNRISVVSEGRRVDLIIVDGVTGAILEK